MMAKKLSATPLGRAAFSEDALRTEVMIGTKQYVLLSAGYDSFIYRRPEWAKELAVFLLDREEVLRDRRERSEKAGLTASGAYAEIAADFSQSGWLDRLTACEAFSAKKRTFIGMLGLTYYLEQEALERMLSVLGDLLTDGSAIAFDYMDVGGTQKAARLRENTHWTWILSFWAGQTGRNML